MIYPTPPFATALLIVIGVYIGLAAVVGVARRLVRRLRRIYGNS